MKRCLEKPKCSCQNLKSFWKTFSSQLLEFFSVSRDLDEKQEKSKCFRLFVAENSVILISKKSFQQYFELCSICRQNYKNSPERIARFQNWKRNTSQKINIISVFFSIDFETSVYINFQSSSISSMASKAMVWVCSAVFFTIFSLTVV